MTYVLKNIGAADSLRFSRRDFRRMCEQSGARFLQRIFSNILVRTSLTWVTDW